MAMPANSATGSFNNVHAEDSVFGAISHAIAPVFVPAGFGNWQAAGSLITGFIAKEVVIGTMSQIYVDEAPGAEAAAEVGTEPEATPTLAEDVGELVLTFGEAIALTVQETVNSVPGTVNIIPGVEMAEADFLGAAEEEESTTALESALGATFTPLAAVAFNVFVLLYVPCMVVVAAMRQEFGARWMLYQVGYTLAVAWVVAVVVYQAGRLLGLG